MPENGGMYDVVLRDAAQGQCVLTVVKRRVVIYRVHVAGEHARRANPLEHPLETECGVRDRVSRRCRHDDLVDFHQRVATIR